MWSNHDHTMYNYMRPKGLISQSSKLDVDNAWPQRRTYFVSSSAASMAL